MSRIDVSFRSFPGAPDETRPLHFTRTDLAHAAVAVGRDWRQRGIDAAERAHIANRITDIRSIVSHARGGRIEVTHVYRHLGTTERGTKSFVLGNTLCALIAEKELGIPWLVDLEKPGSSYRVKYRPGGRRADFIGRTTSGRWYAFEAKGRSSMPRPQEVKEWKEQARTVLRVRDEPVLANIVSAAVVRDDDVIEALWIDPPPSRTGDIDLPASEFFARYYIPKIRFLDQPGKTIQMGGERLVYFPDLGLHIGLHSAVRTAVLRRDPQAIIAFARRHDGSSLHGGKAGEDSEEARVFSDGLIIKLDGGW